MTEENFKVGDVVRVKSGGPNMTVLELSRYASEIVGYTCGYFDKKNRFRKAYVTTGSIIRN